MRRARELLRYHEMIVNLVKRELRGRYKGSILGFMWTFINPLCQIIVYTIVFSLIVRSDLDKFYVYMITGMIPWLFFDNSIRMGSGCIRYQGDMVKKIYFPREVLPVATVTANFINMLFCFIIVFLVLFVSGVGISLKALFCLPLIMMVEYVMVLGFTLIISAGTVFFKDLEHIVNVLLMAWIYLTPILYPITSVPGKLSWIFKLNPMTYIIEAYHAVLYWKTVPTAVVMSRAIVAATVVLILGEFVFARLDDNFAEEL